MPSIWTSVFRLLYQTVNQLFYRASVLSIPIYITLRSSNTYMLSEKKLSLCINRAKTNVLVFPLRLQSIILSLSIGLGEYSKVFWKNLAWKALNQCTQVHWDQIWVLSSLKSRLATFSGSSISRFEFYIHCFNPVGRILYLFLIQRAIITEQNLTVLSTLFLCTFSRYSKLFYNPTSL